MTEFNPHKLAVRGSNYLSLSGAEVDAVLEICAKEDSVGQLPLPAT
jgi:hypothetical protein